MPSLGAICLALAAALIFLWVIDQRGLTASGGMMLGGTGLGALGGALLLLGRMIGHPADDGNRGHTPRSSADGA
jgi:hypothetical protein